MTKTSESIYNKHNSEVVELVNKIEKLAHIKLNKLSRWQANGGNHSTTITYAIHWGERTAQFRLMPEDHVIAYTQISQNEGTTKRCEAYKKLFKLYLATLEDNFGTVDYNNKTYYFTQQAYSNNYETNGEVRYYATAIDSKENEYQVCWLTTAEWDEANDTATDDDYDSIIEDESNACEWDKPYEIIEL